jgi:hypothetical protein
MFHIMKKSTATTLPQRIYDLFIGLYEHDYIGHEDVIGIKSWLYSLAKGGYKFPPLQNSTGTDTDLLVPQSQPFIEGQSFRAYPYFNVDDQGRTFYLAGKSNVTYEEWKANGMAMRPKTAVIKIIMITMDEWPLIRSWVMVSES